MASDPRTYLTLSSDLHIHAHTHTHRQQKPAINLARTNVVLALGDVAKQNHQPRMDGSNPKDGEGRAGSTHLSEKHREVLCTLSLADSFPSSTFGGFDHQRKSYFFCCLRKKDRQTPLKMGQSPTPGHREACLTLACSYHADPTHLLLPAGLHPHLSHSPAHKCLPGH